MSGLRPCLSRRGSDGDGGGGGSLAKGDETMSSGANTVDYVPGNSPDPLWIFVRDDIDCYVSSIEIGTR